MCDLGVFTLDLSTNKISLNVELSVSAYCVITLTKFSYNPKELFKAKKVLKEFDKYKPSYDEIPECASQRIIHAHMILYLAHLELYQRAKESFDHSVEEFQNIVDVVPQSGMEQVTMPNSVLKAKTLTFSDSMPGYSVSTDNNIDATRMHQDDGDISMSDFIKRPVKIDTFEWSTTTSLARELNPWQSFLENPRVSNRINNYRMFRGTLHLKVLINGTPFHYGRGIVAYQPLFTFDTLSTHAALIPQDLIQTTQLPRIFLNPTTSTGGEMKLPFFWHLNYCDLVASDYIKLGKIYFRSVGDLKHANASTDPVQITVFAWMEDFAVAVPTAVNMAGLVAQSGNEQDEANVKGYISGPASNVAKVAKALSVVPTLKPYAMATQQVADMVAGMARRMGYSSPIITKAPEYIISRPAGQLALTTVPSSASKLTVDDKQELTIDPRVAGIDATDPLILSSIAQRETYLTSFTWPVVRAADNVLFDIRVTPVIFDRSGPPGGTALHLPACAVAALPFQYWTGTMKYRFQIVASAFHRGRLAIKYDPVSFAFRDPSEFNINYTRIVDLAEENDFTIEVGPSQTKTYMTHVNPKDTLVNNYCFSTTGNLLPEETDNGVLEITIINPLTVPNTTIDNDVRVNVYVSACDDFKVGAPDSTFLSQLLLYPNDPVPVLRSVEQEQSEMTSNIEISEDLQPQSGIADDVGITNQVDAPMHMDSDQLGVGEQYLDDLDKVFMGETVSSFRTLIKRYEQHESLKLDTGYTTIIRPSHPYIKGYAPESPYSTSIGDPYNYVSFTLFNFIRSAFAGYRGSIRWKAVPVVYAINVTNMFHMTVTRLNRNSSRDAYGSFVNGLATVSSSAVAKNRMQTIDETASRYNGTFGNGGALTNINYANTVLDFEIPYYSNERFIPGKPARDLLTNSARVPGYRLHVDCNTTAGSSRIDMYVAAGDDAQFLFWTGVPRLYEFAVIPDPI